MHLICAIFIDRCISMANSSIAKCLRRKTVARWMSFGMIILAILTNIYDIFLYEIHPDKVLNENIYSFLQCDLKPGFKPFIYEIWPLINALLYSFIPGKFHKFDPKIINFIKLWRRISRLILDVERSFNYQNDRKNV